MRRREFIRMIGGAALAWPLPLRAQEQKSIGDQLVGTWTLVLAITVNKDGSSMSRSGPDPKGIFVFDANGHYAYMMIRTSNPILSPRMVSNFGTYSLNEADGTLTTTIEGSSNPQLNGISQKRIITSLTDNELKYRNPLTASGRIGEAVWSRAK